MSELHLPLILFPLFFFVALLYTSVGQGGASGYLAVFALSGVISPAVAPVTLALNCLAAAIGFAVYRQSGEFSMRLLLPFVITSIPAAFIGGLIPVPERIFIPILGGALLSAATLTLFFRKDSVRPGEGGQIHKPFAYFIGSVIGMISGVTGIGGGIFLAPVLLLRGWASVKQAAAVSSGFIVLNSAGGLGGHILRGSLDYHAVLLLSAVVAVGAVAGSLTGTRLLNDTQLRVVLGVLLTAAGIRALLW